MVGPQGGWTWLNGNGRRAHESPDSDDFVLSLGDGPAWHLSSVVYEIFPDRFATSGLGVDAPDWAVPRGWNELPTGRGPNTPRELFGGDLRGIEQRLDYIEQLGVNALYLTPIFPASSTHRYDATSFDRVDPLLGGDEALRSLLAAAHARGIRVARRPDDEPHGQRARVVRRGARRPERARARVVLLRPEPAGRLRVVARHPEPAEARLALDRAPPRGWSA